MARLTCSHVPRTVLSGESVERYILKELERLNEQYEKLDERMDEIVKRLIKLERVAWLLGGSLAFVSPVIIWAAIELVKKLTA